mmetsp:Transcript_1195/g.3570  ORF Transcript_1195/g.3570 Transcript_1195/m.3570 type:complete len:269 (-) Transcript_1195:118-924(-)
MTRTAPGRAQQNGLLETCAGLNSAYGGNSSNFSPDFAAEVHVRHCFDVLTAHLTKKPRPDSSFVDTTCPLFVTWSKSSGGVGRRKGGYSLRGCIGTLAPRQLTGALPEYALTAALRDPRFPPITQGELTSLRCTVSLLHGFESASGWRDWQVGTHGLMIAFDDPETGARRTATFLPEVAEGEGWDVLHTVDALIFKSGFRGDVTPQLRDSLRVTRYQSTAYSMTHDEYLASAAATAAAGRSARQAQPLEPLPLEPLQPGSPLVGPLPA